MMLVSRLLRFALSADAAATGAMALLMLVFGSTLERALAIPASLLFYVGLALVPWAAFVGFVALRPVVARAVVWTIVGCNVIWIAESLLALVLGWISPNALGTAFVVGQALAVGAFVELQYVGLRRSTPSGAAPLQSAVGIQR